MPRINCVSCQLEEKSFSPQFKLISQKCGWINTLAEEVCTLITNFRPLKLPALESAIRTHTACPELALLPTQELQLIP